MNSMKNAVEHQSVSASTTSSKAIQLKINYSNRKKRSSSISFLLFKHENVKCTVKFTFPRREFLQFFDLIKIESIQLSHAVDDNRGIFAS